nr:branched-chain amino acid ABC transporter permease [Secundilactobacillus hailunensis]
MILKANWKYNLCWLILMVAGFYLMNTLILVGIINSFLENMMVTIGINIILAVGLNLVIGFAGQFSLGHAGFMAVGAYATAIMISKTPTAGTFYISIIVGVIVAIIAALVVGIPTLRLRGDYLAIATMGAAEIIRIIINNLKITNGPSGMFNIPQFATWPVVYIMVCVTTIIIVNFIHSRGGRAALAVREDEIAAESMGINVFKWKLAAFVLGAATAAVAGSMQASYLQTIAPSNFNIMESIAILIIVVLGGVGSITGSFVAAGILGVVDAALQNFGALRMVIYALVLILIMIFKPSGIMGATELSFKRLFNRKNKKVGAKS